jgi:hypothetical protein
MVCIYNVFFQQDVHVCNEKKMCRHLEISLLVCVTVFIHCGLHFISVNKQINDKERIAAAMENPDLRDLVEECIQDGD